MEERIKFPHDHRVWAKSFIFCETLNFINVLCQIFFTNIFLGGSFLNYGSEVFYWQSLDPEIRVDPMSRVFPRLTKCDFHRFGPSGTIENYDALCVLGMNILNEKIFIFLWFWFLLMTLVTGLHLIMKITLLSMLELER